MKKRNKISRIEKAIQSLYNIFGCPINITFRVSQQGIFLVKVSRTDYANSDDDEPDDTPIEPLQVKMKQSRDLSQRPQDYIG